jgi:quercetin dioxygenase-like cupin family protein
MVMKERVMKSLFAGLILTLPALSAAGDEVQLSRYQDLLGRKPDHEARNARVWTVKQDGAIRINVVEIAGEVPMHEHPDASHTIMVLEGRLRAKVGDKTIELSLGDYLSIPARVPHKYWSLTPKVRIVSMDAPYYDSKKTVWLE